jgi:hypothetical protein
MDMEMHAAGMELSSTFEGHVLPGSMFLLWAFIWMAEVFLRRRGGPGRTLESGIFVPLVKVVIPLVGVWVEIPGQGWYPADVMMSWQHVTMYSVFSLSGVVDLLARRGLLSNGSTYVAFAAAHANAGFLFMGHSGHGPIVEGLVHLLLAMVFFSVAGFALAELARPAAGLHWMRMGAQLVLGSWFIVGGWILYRSGWDLAAPFNEGWSSMAFSWLVVAVSVLTVGVRILAGTRTARAAEKTVG